MTRSERSRYKDVSEADFQAQIIDALHLHGWVVAHFRPAMTQSGGWVTPVAADGKGFPDLFAVHPKTGDVLAVELKREYEQATPEQQQWLVWIETAGIYAEVWRPSMIDAALERIAEPRKRQRRAWEDGVLRAARPVDVFVAHRTDEPSAMRVAASFVDALALVPDLAGLDHVNEDRGRGDPEAIGWDLAFYDPDPEDPDALVVRVHTLNVHADGREEIGYQDDVTLRRFSVVYGNPTVQESLP